MEMLASDVNNPQFVGAHDPDMAHSVKFYIKPIEQPFKSSLAGRPIFEDVTYIQIFTPGNVLNIVDTPMREEHKQRFPRQWMAFQSAQSGDQREIGTPLSSWSFLSPSQVEEFRALKFFTVENLANAADQQIGNLGMMAGMNPLVLRDRAKAFLQAAAGTAVAEHAASENAKLKEQMAAMQAQIQSLMGGGIPQPVKADPVEKKRRVLSDEHLAKLKAGRDKRQQESASA